jgi:hypothetical protein
MPSGEKEPLKKLLKKRRIFLPWDNNRGGRQASPPDLPEMNNDNFDMRKDS